MHTLNSLLSENPILYVALLSALALLPLFLLAMTSYIKLSVVFAIVKNAIGAQQVPSTAITTVLSLILTIFIMSPVAEQSKDAFLERENSGIAARPKKESSVAELSRLFYRVVDSSVPLKKWLLKHSDPKYLLFFESVRIEQSASGGEGDLEALSPKAFDENTPFSSILISFVISELNSAFSIGVAVFLPFLAIDLVVAILLMSLGMMMVSPVTISLPFKLLLLVAGDGWFLLCKSLLLSYQ